MHEHKIVVIKFYFGSLRRIIKNTLVLPWCLTRTGFFKVMDSYLYILNLPLENIQVSIGALFCLNAEN